MVEREVTMKRNQVKDTMYATKNRFEAGYRYDVAFETDPNHYGHFKTEADMLDWFKTFGIVVSMDDDCIVSAIWVDGEDCFGRYSID